MARTYDRRAQDVGNILALEHVNVRVPDQVLATVYYVQGLGLTLIAGWSAAAGTADGACSPEASRSGVEPGRPGREILPGPAPRERVESGSTRLSSPGFFSGRTRIFTGQGQR